MDTAFKIFVDRLKEGEIQTIKETLSPEFLEVDEAELSFPDPVKIAGEAYLADEHLVLHLKVESVALMPCSICNQIVRVPIRVGDFYHAEPVKELKGATFDYLEPLREAFLLEVPQFIECNEGKCPERGSIHEYLKPPSKGKGSEEHFFPFSDLDK